MRIEKIIKYSGRRSFFVIGIDEAGRGPLAGPVVVGGVKIKLARDESGRAEIKKIFAGIRDSKKLSAKKREEWYLALTAVPEIEWAVAKVGPKMIDKINIFRATLLAARRVFEKLSSNNCHVFLDGGLYLPREFSQSTIIKGDELIPCISAASIIAKVTRDRLMARLHRKFPQYRFDLHKGYGTKLHKEKLKRFGGSPAHRKSFSF